MDKKTTDIVAYITILGWLVAYVAGEREDSKFHLNQALVVNLALIILAMLMRIPLIGWVAALVQLAVIVFWIMGILYAVKNRIMKFRCLGA